MLLGVVLDRNNNLMLISELCEQQSIKKFLEKFKGKTPASVKMRMIFDLAKAFYYLH
jgi:Protein tyrosine and serine/threonine kinase